MPFGLESAPETFEMAMDVFLESVKLQSALSYIDKVTIFLKPPQQHLDQIGRSLETGNECSHESEVEEVSYHLKNR